MAKRTKRTSAPLTCKASTPVTTTTPQTPWPMPSLARLSWRAPEGIVTSRSEAMAHALHSKGDLKYEGFLYTIMHTWPQDFVRHCTLAPEATFPTFTPTNKWNPVLARKLKAFTNETHAVRQGDSVFRLIVLTGAAAFGKTHDTGLYAVAWWMLDPANSIAILTSTTKDMIRNRVWSVVRHYASTCRDLQTGIEFPIGRLVDSQMKLVHDGATSTNAASISAYAVAHGETLKAIDNLKGLHAKRMLVVIDEANGTPEAIFNVIPNYRKACLDLTVIIIGNPCMRLDPHGRACTPHEGWAIFNENLHEWRTRAIPEWQLDSGLCLRFDGRDSPNVKLGRNAYPYIYTLDNWKMAEAHAGTFSYWTQDRGMWPPEGFANTVFTEQLFVRCLADERGHDLPPFTFTSTADTYAFLDTAFGGDACKFQVARMGDVDGRMCIQLTESFEIPIDPNASAHDIDYQIARRVQQECITRRIKPECFGLDATGIGRGVAAIMASEWSERICYLTWGQAATERPSAQNDGRPAREVYDRFATEMHFSVREALEAGQIRGFTREAITQFCSRLYEMSGKKYKLEPKDEMKLRLRFSPDDADAVTGLLEVCRRAGMSIDNARMTATASREWRAGLSERDSIYGIEPTTDASVAHSSDGGWADEGVHGGVTVEHADVGW